MEGPFPAPAKGIDTLQLEVVQWCPNPNGENPTQVWLVLRVTDDAETPPIILRFKGPDTLDELITALTHHRVEVFGEFRS